MQTNIESMSGKRPKPLWPSAQRVHTILKTHGPLGTKRIVKLLPPLLRNLSGVRSRIAELRAHGLVVTEDLALNGRNLRAHRAVGNLPAAANEHVEIQNPASHDGTTAAAASAVSRSSCNLVYLDEENAFMERFSPQPRTVTIEWVSQAWLVRFLPVGLGERNLWFARMGQHWMNKQPIICPKCVSPDFGGDPNAECPVCYVAELLNATDNEALSKFGLKLKANLNYLTHCLVYQIDTGRGEIQEMSKNEILKPWEFHLDTRTFTKLMDYFRRGVATSRPFSVLDLEKGNDFWATRTTKGTRLDRQDPGPVFGLSDPNYEQKIDQIWSAIAQPRVKIPTLKELETFARKAVVAARKNASASPDGSPSPVKER